MRDYVAYRADPAVESILEATLHTLFRVLSDYQLPNGWTYYDNKGLICSPFYHMYHIALLEALRRITSEPKIETVLAHCRRAGSPLNRVRYTLVRAAVKLREKGVFAGEA